jgi:prepilin-type N-terminal cleavage/methylation domain-containing protein
MSMHIKNSKEKGFTLIELLVVIAIIGILASVVLASLNTARAKGADAAIKSNLNNARAQAEIFYDGPGNNSYSAVCLTPTTGIGQFRTGALSAGSATVNCTDSANPNSAWAMEATLKTVATNYYCVDSTGKAGVTGGPKTGTVCP